MNEYGEGMKNLQRVGAFERLAYFLDEKGEEELADFIRITARDNFILEYNARETLFKRLVNVYKSASIICKNYTRSKSLNPIQVLHRNIEILSKEVTITRSLVHELKKIFGGGKIKEPDEQDKRDPGERRRAIRRFVKRSNRNDLNEIAFRRSISQ